MSFSFSFAEGFEHDGLRAIPPGDEGEVRLKVFISCKEDSNVIDIGIVDLFCRTALPRPLSGFDRRKRLDRYIPVGKSDTRKSICLGIFAQGGSFVHGFSVGIDSSLWNVDDASSA